MTSLQHSGRLPFRLAVSDRFDFNSLLAHHYSQKPFDCSTLQQRLECLLWDTSDNFDQFLDCFKFRSTFHSLRTLSIQERESCRSCRKYVNFDDMSETRTFVGFNRCRFPALGELDLDSVMFRPTGNLIRGLNRLSIHSMHLSHWDYRLILSYGRQLEILEIRGLHNVQAGLANDEDATTFTLPCLRELYFKYDPEEVILYVLDRCNAPHLQFLSIRDTEDATETPIDETAVSAILDSGLWSASLSEALVRFVSGHCA